MRRPVTRRRQEQAIQTAIVVALHREFDCRAIHVANGGSRSITEAVHLKEMGVWAGHPDLVVYGRDGKVLLIEVKEKVQARERAVPLVARLTTLSDSQKLAVPELRERGFTVAVVDSVEDAVSAVRDAGFGARATRPRWAAELATGF